MIAKAAFPKLLTQPGRHADGGGLYLRVKQDKKTGALYSNFEYQYSLRGKARWVCIGSTRVFNLDEARARHRIMRQQVSDGIDLVEARGGRWGKHRIVPAAVDPTYPWPTFQAAAEHYLEVKTGHDFGAAQARDHRTRLKLALPAIGAMTVDKIKPSHVISILKPLWGGTGNTRGPPSLGACWSASWRP
jgi:hypothetical protein